jgi:hypothetical protein
MSIPGRRGDAGGGLVPRPKLFGKARIFRLEKEDDPPFDALAVAGGMTGSELARAIIREKIKESEKK